VKFIASVWFMAHMMQKESDSIACIHLKQILICAGKNGNPSPLGAFHHGAEL